MAKYLIDDSTLISIADVIRDKTGSSQGITPESMATEITNMSSGNIEGPYIEETYDSSGNLIEAKMVGYTKIRDYMFYECRNLTLTSLPSGITSIGRNAFYDCNNLALTSLPSGITAIGQYAFYNCSKLALTSLPSGITRIENYTFSDCTKLETMRVHSGINEIKNQSFSGCTNLIEVTFEGTPTTINGLAFYNCKNLTTINVPWSEGEVANAPWGATNATINYNYTA